MAKEQKKERDHRIVLLGEAFGLMYSVVEVRQEALANMTVAGLVQLEEECKMIRKHKREGKIK